MKSSASTEAYEEIQKEFIEAIKDFKAFIVPIIIVKGDMLEVKTLSCNVPPELNQYVYKSLCDAFDNLETKTSNTE